MQKVRYVTVIIVNPTIDEILKVKKIIFVKFSKMPSKAV